MKRKLLLCLSLLLLTGCAGEASMTLTPKKLKTQTENVLHILNWNGKFYDFQGREPIKQATFQTWSLTKDGAWEPIGTPEELMAAKGKYYKLIQIQTMAEQAEAGRREEGFGD